MRIDKRLKWAKPYIMNALKVYPGLRKVRQIKAVNTGADLGMDGPTKAYYDSEKMIIALSLYVDSVCPLDKYNRVEILETIAHELTHAYHGEHVPFINFIYTESGILGTMVGRSISENDVRVLRRKKKHK